MLVRTKFFTHHMSLCWFTELCDRSPPLINMPGPSIACGSSTRMDCKEIGFRAGRYAFLTRSTAPTRK